MEKGRPWWDSLFLGVTGLALQSLTSCQLHPGRWFRLSQASCLLILPIGRRLNPSSLPSPNAMVFKVYKKGANS